MTISVLRDVDDSDCEQLLAWRNRDDIRRYMYSDRIITPDEHRQWFDQMRADKSRKYWIITDGANDLGMACLVDIDKTHRRCQWAFYLGEIRAHGTGMAALAEYEVLGHVFEMLNLNKLCCEVLDFNTAVVQIHRRFGFRTDGVLRQHVWKGDRFYNVIAMSLLQAEWPEKKTELTALVERLRNRISFSQGHPRSDEQRD